MAHTYIAHIWQYPRPRGNQLLLKPGKHLRAASKQAKIMLEGFDPAHLFFNAHWLYMNYISFCFYWLVEYWVSCMSTHLLHFAKFCARSAPKMAYTEKNIQQGTLSHNHCPLLTTVCLHTQSVLNESLTMAAITFSTTLVFYSIPYYRKLTMHFIKWIRFYKI